MRGIMGVAATAAILLAAPGGGTFHPCPECEPEAPIIEEPRQGPTRVFLGVDCTEPFTVSLPDDVLTECE